MSYKLAWALGLSGILLYICYGALVNMQHLLGLPIIGQSPIRILALLLLFIALFCVPASIPKRPAIALVLFAIFSALSITARSYNPEISPAAYLSDLTTYTFLPLIVAAALALQSVRLCPQRSLFALAGLLGGLLILGIMQWWLRDPLVWLGTPNSWMPVIWRGRYLGPGEFEIRAFSTFLSPVQFGMVAAVTALSGLALWPRHRLWATVLMICGGLAAYASLNRTALVGLAAGAVVMLVLRRFPQTGRRLPFLLTVLPVAITALLLLAPATLRSATDAQLLTGIFDARNLIIRLDDYPKVLQRVTATPRDLLIGHPDIEKLTLIKTNRADGIGSLPIDNELLFLVGHFGIPGLAAMLAILFTLSSWTVREWHRHRHPIALAALGFLTTWSIGIPFNVIFLFALPLVSSLFLLVTAHSPPKISSITARARKLRFRP